MLKHKASFTSPAKPVSESQQHGPTTLGAVAAMCLLTNQILAPALHPKHSLWSRSLLCPPSCTKGLQSSHGSICTKHRTNPHCKYLVAILTVSWHLSQMQRSLQVRTTPVFFPPSTQGRAWECEDPVSSQSRGYKSQSPTLFQVIGLIMIMKFCCSQNAWAPKIHSFYSIR